MTGSSGNRGDSKSDRKDDAKAEGNFIPNDDFKIDNPTSDAIRDASFNAEQSKAFDINTYIAKFLPTFITEKNQKIAAIVNELQNLPEFKDYLIQAKLNGLTEATLAEMVSHPENFLTDPSKTDSFRSFMRMQLASLADFAEKRLREISKKLPSIVYPSIQDQMANELKEVAKNIDRATSEALKQKPLQLPSVNLLHPKRIRKIPAEIQKEDLELKTQELKNALQKFNEKIKARQLSTKERTDFIEALNRYRDSMKAVNIAILSYVPANPKKSNEVYKITAADNVGQEGDEKKSVVKGYKEIDVDWIQQFLDNAEQIYQIINDLERSHQGLLIMQANFLNKAIQTQRKDKLVALIESGASIKALLEEIYFYSMAVRTYKRDFGKIGGPELPLLPSGASPSGVLPELNIYENILIANSYPERILQAYINNKLKWEPILGCEIPFVDPRTQYYKNLFLNREQLLKEAIYGIYEHSGKNFPVNIRAKFIYDRLPALKTDDAAQREVILKLLINSITEFENQLEDDQTAQNFRFKHPTIWNIPIEVLALIAPMPDRDYQPSPPREAENIPNLSPLSPNSDTIVPLKKQASVRGGEISKIGRVSRSSISQSRLSATSRLGRNQSSRNVLDAKILLPHEAFWKGFVIGYKYVNVESKRNVEIDNKRNAEIENKRKAEIDKLDLTRNSKNIITLFRHADVFGQNEKKHEANKPKLFSMSVANKDNIKDELLIARNKNIPLVIEEKDTSKFFIYGDKEGDGTFDFTEITEGLDEIRKLTNSGGFILGNDPHFPSLIEILKPGHVYSNVWEDENNLYDCYKKFLSEQIIDRYSLTAARQMELEKLVRLQWIKENHPDHDAKFTALISQFEERMKKESSEINTSKLNTLLLEKYNEYLAQIEERIRKASPNITGDALKVEVTKEWRNRYKLEGVNDFETFTKQFEDTDQYDEIVKTANQEELQWIKAQFNDLMQREWIAKNPNLEPPDAKSYEDSYPQKYNKLLVQATDSVLETRTLMSEVNTKLNNIPSTPQSGVLSGSSPSPLHRGKTQTNLETTSTSSPQEHKRGSLKTGSPQEHKRGSLKTGSPNEHRGSNTSSTGKIKRESITSNISPKPRVPGGPERGSLLRTSPSTNQPTGSPLDQKRSSNTAIKKARQVQRDELAEMWNLSLTLPSVVLSSDNSASSNSPSPTTSSSSNLRPPDSNTVGLSPRRRAKVEEENNRSASNNNASLSSSSADTSSMASPAFTTSPNLQVPTSNKGGLSPRRQAMVGGTLLSEQVSGSSGRTSSEPVNSASQTNQSTPKDNKELSPPRQTVQSQSGVQNQSSGSNGNHHSLFKRRGHRRGGLATIADSRSINPGSIDAGQNEPSNTSPRSANSTGGKK